MNWKLYGNKYLPFNDILHILKIWSSSGKSLIRFSSLHVSLKFFSYFNERERFEREKCGWMGNMGTDDGYEISTLQTLFFIFFIFLRTCKHSFYEGIFIPTSIDKNESITLFTRQFWKHLRCICNSGLADKDSGLQFYYVA